MDYHCRLTVANLLMFLINRHHPVHLTQCDLLQEGLREHKEEEDGGVYRNVINSSKLLVSTTRAATSVGHL